MKYAKDSQGDVIAASLTTSDAGPFRCYGCGADVILRRGPAVRAHFSHKRVVEACSYATVPAPEFVHYIEKKERTLFGSNQVGSLDLGDGPNPLPASTILVTVHTEDHYPLSIILADHHLHHSRAPHILEWCTEQGMYSLWIYTDLPKQHHPRELSALERYLHTLYFGRIYYYQPDWNAVIPVHFDVSSSHRLPHFAPRTVDLVHDLSPQKRKGGKYGRHEIPDCFLWMDKFYPWWTKE